MGADPFREQGCPLGELAEVGRARCDDDEVGFHLGPVVERGHKCAAVALEERDEAIADGHVFLRLEPGGVLQEQGDGDRIDVGRGKPALLDEGLKGVNA